MSLMTTHPAVQRAATTLLESNNYLDANDKINHKQLEYAFEQQFNCKVINVDGDDLGIETHIVFDHPSDETMFLLKWG
jgi:hypothetical protein